MDHTLQKWHKNLIWQLNQWILPYYNQLLTHVYHILFWLWGKWGLNLSYYVKHSSGKLLSIKEKIYCKLIIYMLQWIIGFWVSHGQVLWQWICCCVIWNYYMKICLLKPQYFFLRNYLDPSFENNFCFLPSLHIFNSTKLCTDMGIYICNVCCVNG